MESTQYWPNLSWKRFVVDCLDLTTFNISADKLLLSWLNLNNIKLFLCLTYKRGKKYNTSLFPDGISWGMELFYSLEAFFVPYQPYCIDFKLLNLELT